MPIYEYECDNPQCSHTVEELETRDEHESQPHGGDCIVCTIGILMQVVTAPSRTVSRWGDTDSCRI